jgi:hypothetical protein
MAAMASVGEQVWSPTPAQAVRLSRLGRTAGLLGPAIVEGGADGPVPHAGLVEGERAPCAAIVRVGHADIAGRVGSATLDRRIAAREPAPPLITPAGAVLRADAVATAVVEVGTVAEVAKPVRSAGGVTVAVPLAATPAPAIDAGVGTGGAGVAARTAVLGIALRIDPGRAARHRPRGASRWRRRG